MIRYLLAIGALVVVAAAIGSCGPFGSLSPASPPATQSPTPTVQPTVTPQIPVPTARRGVTQEEAQSAVRLWFDAIVAQDYAAAELVTSGNATARTKDLADGFRQATSGKGFDVGMHQQKLDLGPGHSVAAGQSVDSQFDIEVDARVGPFAVGSQEIKGSATFVVEMVDGQPKITDIQDVTGLPSP